MLAAVIALPLSAQDARPAEILFTNVCVFDGSADSLSAPTDVLVRGNVITAIGKDAAGSGPETAMVEGRGRTLMPGLIDNHVHMMFYSLTPRQMTDPGMGLETVMQRSARQAQAMLMRGFTSVRDVGGPSFDLKRMIDGGKFWGRASGRPAR